MLGLRVILHYLSGGSKENASDFYGKEIESAVMDEERIILGFTDGIKIRIFDNGQSCCEYRHMTTDDDIQSLVGGRLERIEAKDGPNMDGGECHETRFVEIATNKGFVTIVNHNEHNGYYGGFGLCISKE